MSEDQHPLRQIVVGVDGSEGAARAVRWAAEVARACSAEVTVVTAADWVAAFGGGEHPEIEELRSKLETTWTEPLRQRGVTYHIRLEPADPRVLIPEVAEAVDADLVVVGTRGLGKVSEVLLGSVASYLTHNSPVPVVVIPPGAKT